MKVSRLSWFVQIGGAIGAVAFIAKNQSVGGSGPLFFGVVGAIFGGLVGAIVHWALFDFVAGLPKVLLDVANGIAEWLREVSTLLREYWLIPTAIILGIIVFAGVR